MPHILSYGSVLKIFEIIFETIITYHAMGRFRKWQTHDIFLIFISCHTIVAGYYCFMLDVSVSIHLSVCLLYSHPAILHISYTDDNFCKHQWILIEFGMCIDIIEI